MSAADLTAAGFATADEAVEDIRAGRFVIVAEGADPADEGLLVVAAEHATPEAIAFMLRDARGLLLLCLTPDRERDLGIGPRDGPAPTDWKAGLGVSIDARDRVGDGSSASDRAETIRRALDPAALLRDFVRPGHVFPLYARDGGLLARAGRTEAAVDLPRLAGLAPAGVAADIITDAGRVAQLAELMEFSREHGIKVVRVTDLLRRRMREDRLVARTTTVSLPTPYGDFRAAAYRHRFGSEHHIALVHGRLADAEAVPVAVHVECFAGDVFGACDCATVLQDALASVVQEDAGILIYLLRRHPRLAGFPACAGSGGLTPVECGVAAHILLDSGLASARLVRDDSDLHASLSELGVAMER